MTMSTIALAIISATGSSTVASVLPKAGRVSSALLLATLEQVRGGYVDPATGEPAEQRTGDDHGRDGDEHAEHQRRTEVGAQGVDRDERAGVGRHQAVHGREAGEGGDADGDHGHLGAPGHQVDDRHQHHEADLEEHRQPDERTDAGHRPRQRPARGAADDRVDDLVGTAGVGEQLGEHRAQRDQGADAGGRRTEAGGEAGDDVVDVLAGDQADGEAAEDQRQERVHLGPGDQHHDQADGQQCGDHQLPPAGDGFDQRCWVGEGDEGGVHECSVHGWSAGRVVLVDVGLDDRVDALVDVDDAGRARRGRGARGWRTASRAATPA